MTLRRFQVAKWIGVVVCLLIPCLAIWPSSPMLVVSPWHMLGLAVALILTVTMRALDRRARRPPPGHCRRCGYDLTGNVSGRCPECGRYSGTWPEAGGP